MSGFNPFKDGLPATSSYNGPTGESKLLLLGIETATRGIRKGWEVRADDYRYYDKLIKRVEGLKQAMADRLQILEDSDD